MTLRHILLVDDDPLVLRAMERTLQHGRAIHTATNRKQALSHALREPLDLAIVDWILGADDGMALIQELKTIQPRLNAVLVSACASIDVAVDAVHAGALRVAAKPFCFQTLVRSLEGEPVSAPKWIPSMQQVEREHVLRAVRDCNGNVSRAAALLGISRTTVYRCVRGRVPPRKRRKK